MKKFLYALTIVGFVPALTGLVAGISVAETKRILSPPSEENSKQLTQIKSKSSPGYDPTKDPGSSDQGKSVDYEKLKGLIEKFDGGIKQKSQNQKPAEAQPAVPIPKEYSSPGGPSESKEAPQDLGGQPASKLGSTDLSNPLIPATEKGILQQHQK